MLLLPALVALDLPGAVAGAGFPGNREVPALSSVLSLLALKATGRRGVSHVDDVCVDPALATFAGLESLPKTSSLGGDLDTTLTACRVNSRTYSPIMRNAALPPIEIAWWNGRQLRFQFA